MKKLLFLFALAFFFFSAEAQNGGTIVSKPQSFQQWIQIAKYTVATLPSPAACPRCEVFVQDSLKIAYSNGSSWVYGNGGSSGGSVSWGSLVGNILSQSDLQNQFAHDFKYQDTSSVFRAYLANVLRHSDSTQLLASYALITNTVKYSDSTGGGVLTEFLKNINYNPTTIGLGNVLNRKQVINLGGIDSVEVLNFAGGVGFPTAATGPSLIYAPDSNALYYNNKTAYIKISGGSSGGSGGDDSVHMASRFYVQSTFVPLSSYTPSGIEAALTFVPYNSTNPNGYQSANQVITITPAGDIKGKASGATSITPVDTVTGLLSEALPALAKGVLSNNGAGAWALGSVPLSDTTYFSGALGVPRGGTGVGSFATNAIVFGGVSQQGGLQQLAGSAQITYGSLGQALLSNGSNILPGWATIYKPSDTTATLATKFFVNNKGYLTANQSITLTFGGTDVSGAGSGATAIGFNPVVTGIRGATIPSLANGILRNTSGTWAFDNNQYVTPTILSDSLQLADTINIIYTGSAGNGAIYGNSTAALFARLIQNSQDNADSSLNIYSSARVVHQVAHGFIVGEPVSYGAGVFIGADTNNPALAVVSRVVDANDFEVNMGGWMPWTSNGLTDNNYYYVGEPAGTLTLTSPNKSQPVVYAIDGNNVVVNIMRPHNFNSGSGVLTSIPPLDSVLAHGSVSGRSMTVGAFSALSAAISGAVNLTGLNDAITTAGQVVVVDTTTGNVTRYPSQFINMSVSNRNGYVATWDSVNRIFYLGPGGSGGGTSLTMGSLDGQAANAQGGAIVGGQFFQQSASGSLPGLLQAGSSQTLAGNKIWTGAIQEWTGTTIEIPNLPDWVAANFSHYNVVLSDTTNTGKLSIAAAQFINMAGATNNWIPFWNSVAGQFQLEQIPVTGINAGTGGSLFTTSVSAGQVPAISFNITPSSPWTLYGNNTAASAAGVFFTPTLINGMFASEGTTATVLHGNASGNLSFGAVNLGSDITATLATTHGGTGITGYTLGQIIYSNGANTLGVLNGNTTTTKQFLSQTGSGAASAAPAWGPLASSDITAGLTFTPENVANKETTLTNSNTLYPSGAAVQTYATGNFFPLTGGILTGAGGAGFIGFPSQTGTPSTPVASEDIFFNGTANEISFLGNNSNVSTFIFQASATRTYAFPDLSDIITTNTAVQTLSNKTLTSPNFNFGSDQPGDIMVRNTSGAYTNLTIGSISGQVLEVVAGNTLGYGSVLLSSTYTPVLTGVQNVSSITLSQATYSRNGNIVTVTIGGTITPTSSSTITTWSATLPFNTGTTSQIGAASGTMSVNSGSVTAAIFGSVTSSTLVSASCIPTSTTGDTFSVKIQYTL